MISHKLTKTRIQKYQPNDPSTLSNIFPGIAKYLPGISWSTIASLHLPHLHPPVDANEVTHTARIQNGCGGDWPLAIFNEICRPPWGRSVLNVHLRTCKLQSLSWIRTLCQASRQNIGWTTFGPQKSDFL